MTYNVQKWDYYKAGIFPDPNGAYVLAADAEAHEKAAVEKARRDSCGEEMWTDCPCFTGAWQDASIDAALTRQWAIRDCIAAVEGCHVQGPDFDAMIGRDDVMKALRGLLGES